MLFRSAVNDTVTYTAVFKENKETPVPDTDLDETKDNTLKTVGIAVGSVVCAAALGAGGYALYRFIRKKRKGY